MIEFLAAHKPTLGHWLVFTSILFSIGLYGLLSRRNAVGVLMAVEIMLNAAAINFVVFNHFAAARLGRWPDNGDFRYRSGGGGGGGRNGDICGDIQTSRHGRCELYEYDEGLGRRWKS